MLCEERASLRETTASVASARATAHQLLLPLFERGVCTVTTCGFEGLRDGRVTTVLAVDSRCFTAGGSGPGTQRENHRCVVDASLVGTAASA